MSNQAARKPDQAPQPAAGERLNERTSTATVVVGSRLPWPYILETYVLRDEQEQGVGGLRPVKIARRTGKRFVVNGNRVRIGDERRWEIVNGAGLTQGVPADVWAEWYADHKDEPIVINKVIFAHARVEEVKAEAKDVRKILTGLEPFRPDGTDPRKPKPPKGDSVIGDLGKGDVNSDE